MILKEFASDISSQYHTPPEHIIEALRAWEGIDKKVFYTERDSKIGILAAPKPRDSTILSRPHISNIGRLNIVEPRELSRQPKPDS